MDRVSVLLLGREVEVLAGLGEVVLPDPQPLAWWDLEVVEPTHQPQVAEIHAMALVGLGDRRRRVVQLLRAELDAGPILIANNKVSPNSAQAPRRPSQAAWATPSGRFRSLFCGSDREMRNSAPQPASTMFRLKSAAGDRRGVAVGSLAEPLNQGAR